jgi:hypothetical protein
LEILGVTWGDWRELAFNNLVIKAFHISSSEWWVQSAEFIENTTHTPDIALVIVRLILPNFWACVVGSACLSVKKTSFSDFRNI